MRHSTPLKHWLALLALVTGCDFVFRLDHVAPTDADAPPVGRWVDVIAGLAHTCALDQDRHLWCWGRNGSGELGISSALSELDQPRQITEATWTAISSRDATTCGIQQDGSLWCWGANGSGETGTGPSTQPVRTPTMIDAGPWLRVSSYEHTCAIREDHSLWCWGYNERGQLGDGTMTTRFAMAQVVVGSTWDEVSTGNTSTCAIASDRSLWCWGGNTSGQLGLGMPTSAAEPLPRQVSVEPWAQVQVGRSFACGITADGRLRCWGINTSGQLGDGTVSAHFTPAPVFLDGDDRTDVEQLAVGDDHACARTRGAGTWCWGSSARDQIGVDMSAAVVTPVALMAERRWTALATGSAHTCAIAEDQTLWCLGADGNGQLGDGGGSTVAPVQVPGSWSAVAVGEAHTCAFDDAGALFCAGVNQFSQLGVPGLDRQELTSLGVSGFKQLEGGIDHTCGIKSGQVWCWGANNLRQIGTTSADNALAPTMIRNGTTVAAYNHTCTIDPGTNHMLCWGQNDSGQVGNKPQEMPAPPVPTPYEIPTIQWRDVKVGRAFTCGITTSNTLTCWGSNSNGQLASGNMVDSLDPASSAPGFTVDRITLGGFHACALSSTGAATCWGADSFGQLGIGVGSGLKTSPQALGGTWLAISAGTEYTCGIQDPGTLWCWGENARGQLGDGTRIDSAIPKQIGTDEDWSTVSAGDRHTCATKQVDGSLWCWGDNTDGQLATGTSWRTTPVQVP